MGYDICATGEWDINEKHDREAINALLVAFAKKDGYETIVDWIDGEDPTVDPEDRDNALEYISDRMERGTIDHTEDELGFTMRFHDGGYIRHPEDDEWLFRAVAPYADEGNTIYFEGEDGYKWIWEVEKGELVEHSGVTIYGQETKAPDVVGKIVELLYPKGKSVVGMTAKAYEWEQLVHAIEAVVRLGGFGPEAGMSELDRLASAGG